jgi:antitoxin component YwqK of YwqJK toxin-antitoxin module
MALPTKLLVPLSLLLASAAADAQPRESRGLRPGANHHLGDDGFVEKYGREPVPADGEKLRMKMHFAHVHALLSAKPATRPELAKKRTELLGYLAEYMAKGITPKNHHLNERTPVFIDDDDQICAVGYLIERSAGRALPEKIKRSHRFDFIEDIATAMPEVRAWVESSGLSLDEVASIQPGYMGPEIDQWQRWALREMKNGAYEEDEFGYHVAGRFRLQQMQGAWKKTTEDGKLVGTGTFAMGSGKWQSNYKTGTRLAEGRFAGSNPTGTWRFYHPSGNLAAVGQLEGHARRGVWSFYYDTPAKTLFAKGDFRAQTGWQYFDDAGQPLATSSSVSPAAWGKAGWGRLTAITTAANGVRRASFSGGFSYGKAVDDFDGDGELDRPFASVQLDGLASGDDRMVFASVSNLRDDSDDSGGGDDTVIYDGDGRAIAKSEQGVWQARACTWDAARKAALRAEDLPRLGSLLYNTKRNAAKEDCGAAVAVDAARAKRYDALLAVRDGVRSRVPDFVDHIRDNELDEPEPRDAEAGGAEAQDLVRAIEGSRHWDHFDTRFIQVFRTLPGSRFPY